MSAQHCDQAHPGMVDATREAVTQQTIRMDLATAPAPVSAAADAQVAALVRTLAHIVRRQCTVPATAEEGRQP